MQKGGETQAERERERDPSICTRMSPFLLKLVTTKRIVTNTVSAILLIVIPCSAGTY